MKRLYMLALPSLAGLAVILATAPAAAAQQMELRLKGSPGDVSTYVVDATQNLQLPDEFGGEQNVHAMMTVEARLAEVKGDTLVYALVVQNPTVDMNGAGASQSPDLSAVEGKEFTQAVTSTGRAVDFVSPEDAGPGAAAIAASLSQFATLPLPIGAVGPGDSWTDTTRTDGAPMGLPVSGDMVAISTVTVKGFTEEGGSTIADLALESEIVFEPGADAQGAMDIEMSSSLVSNVRFDVTKGLILGRSSASDFTADISGAALPAPISIYGTTESTVTRQ